MTMQTHAVRPESALAETSRAAAALARRRSVQEQRGADAAASARMRARRRRCVIHSFFVTIAGCARDLRNR
jgi:hypothetical protein